MKKLLLGCLAIFLAVGTLAAQDGKKALKDAERSLSKFNLNNDLAELDVAKTAIAEALKDSEIAKTSKAWRVKGDIYNGYISFDMKERLLNPEHPTTMPTAGLMAYDGYEKALEYAVKKWEKKDALKGMSEIGSSLSNEGIASYEAQDYETAFKSFTTVLEISDVLVENGETALLATEDDYNNQMYIAGLAALNGNMVEKAEPIFNKLVEINFEKPAVFEALYKLRTAKGDTDGAIKALEEGRAKFPEDVSLLFAEINYYLQENRLEELIAKLELAIEKEPDNITLYSTMGNVYDNLFQKAKESGDEATAKTYFSNALKYYNQALEKKPDFSDAIYSIGALYYNQAAALTKAMNELPLNETAKYDALKAEVEELFEQSLPYFKKAEMANPNDLNTLIALKEIFARKSDFTTSNEFKDRLEKVQNGETIDNSFFKQ